MSLHVFANDRGSTALDAEKLDSNFRQLQPIKQDGGARVYAINETPSGWSLELFLVELIQRQIPPPASGTYVLGAINGQIRWLPTTDC